MPNIDNLMERIAKHVAKNTGQTFFTTLDMTYAYRQIELRKKNSKTLQFPECWWRSNWSIQIHHGILWTHHDANGISKIKRLNTSRHHKHIRLHRRHPHSNTRHRRRAHAKSNEVLKQLNEANISLKLEKCTFAAKSIDWVGWLQINTKRSGTNKQ